MNSKELMEQVNNELETNWQNSSLSLVSMFLLEEMAEHFEKCPDCRQAFDVQEYPEKTLIEFETNHLFGDVHISDWICGCKWV